ncbi:hypothetical protein [Burkholderia sp. Bp9140]|uniref:hypothetical protein n=1 Tax=Burkholderia sp. Bp9140 TaxID=2184572 RepID=UPI001629BC89|nr:hypothetical protein [Burkholderia sp. Bp9140]
MSVNTIESFLYKLSNDPEIKKAFEVDPDLVLREFPFSDAERCQILLWDLHALIDAGVSPMLLMFGYVSANGGLKAREQYIAILKDKPDR